MSPTSCPVLTAAQRDAGKPWAFLIFASMIAHLVFLTVALISLVVSGAGDFRVFLIVFSSSWLVQRGTTAYCLYRIGKIVESPPRNLWVERSHRVTVTLVALILVATIVSYWW